MNLGPAFPLYADDFMGSDSVTLMSVEEVGGYLLLLIFQWNCGYVPSEIPKLAKICKNITPKKMAALWVNISPCFELSDIPGQLINLKMDAIRKERIEFKERKAEAGAIGGRKSGEVRSKQKGSTPSIVLAEKGSKAEANTQAKRSSPSPSPSPSPEETEEGKENPPAIPSPSGSAFERFWSIYPKKKGKGDAEKAWRRQGLNSLVDVIVAAVGTQTGWPDWNRDGGQYIPHPASWINAKGWEDEFWQPVKTNGNGHTEYTDEQRAEAREQMRREGIIK